MLVVIVEGLYVEALIDTGAAYSVMHFSLCSHLRKVLTPYIGPPLRGANGTLMKPTGQCTARVLIDNQRHHIEFIVLPTCVHLMILGWDFLSSASASSLAVSALFILRTPIYYRLLIVHHHTCSQQLISFCPQDASS